MSIKYNYPPIGVNVLLDLFPQFKDPPCQKTGHPLQDNVIKDRVVP